VISRTHGDFWKCFNGLPAEVQQQARERFRLWQQDNFNPVLHFKPLFADVWSVRVNPQYRALGRRRGSLVVWFWVGTHADYDALLKRLH
jgi:hypothetical protein